MSYEEWIRYAEEDLDMAKATYAMGKYRYSCYFSQQAAEKYLKAFLIKNGRLLRKTHDLLKLLEKSQEIHTR